MLSENCLLVCRTLYKHIVELGPGTVSPGEKMAGTDELDGREKGHESSQGAGC